MMFIHIFGFRWMPAATDGDKERARREILGFGASVPGLLTVQAGRNVSPRGRGYEFAGLMTFSDEAAYAAYTTHPLHVALLEWLAPLIEPVELDFEA